MAKVKVKLLTTMSGPEGCKFPGDVIEVEKAAADELVAGMYAQLVEEKKKPEEKKEAEPKTAEDPKTEEPQKRTATNPKATGKR